MDEMRFPFPDSGHAGPPAEFATESLIPVRLPNETPAIVVCGHEDVRQLLTDDRFSREAAAAHGMTARTKESLALNSVDPPDHSRRRRVVSAPFTARRAETLRPLIRDTAKELVAGMTAGGSRAELIADFALPLSVGVICGLMGVPVEDRPRFEPLVQVMMSTGGHPPPCVKGAHAEMFSYFSELFEAPQDAETVLGILVAAVEEGVLGRNEAIHVAYGLLMAGYETTNNQLAICVYLLLADRSRWDGLRAGRVDLKHAVEEMLRFTMLPATGGAPHVATADLRLGGREIRAGQVLVPAVGAANRDPRAFDEPDELRLSRDGKGNLAFGYGRHLCLGAPLARVELEESLDVLMAELPDLELAVPVEELRWRQGTFIRGLTELPVCWPENRTMRQEPSHRVG